MVDKILDEWVNIINGNPYEKWIYRVMGSCANNGEEPHLISLRFLHNQIERICVFACKKEDIRRSYAHINRISDQLGLFN